MPGLRCQSTILRAIIKRALPISPTTPLNGSNPLGRSAVIDFAGLEPQLSDKVYLACVATLGGDQTERGRIKILSTENEIGMVQNVDGRGLDLKPNRVFSFRYRNPLGHTKVEVEVIRTAEAVHREIAEGTRGRGTH